MERMEIDLEQVRSSLGWNEERQRELEDLGELGEAALVPARVSGESRGRFALMGSEVTSAVVSGRLRLRPEDWPAVGDWVAVQPAAGGGVIHGVLPRRSLLERQRPGSSRSQAIAANVDVAFVVTSPGRELNLRRLERYLSLIWSSRARPVAVLNKCDLCEDAGELLASIARLAPGLECLATSTVDGTGLDRLRSAIPWGHTAVLVGSSGVGKSSLLNALLGESRQSTEEVRARDGKGRHRTTRRELVPVPGGGWVIDTPGMRELALWDAEVGIGRAFEEIEELAAGCRFRDCAHRGEPGCAVVDALATGELAGDRLASFDKLRREQAHQQRVLDPRQQQASKGRWKVIHKQLRARRKVDPKLRDD